MSEWVKCTNKLGNAIYLNLALAMNMHWSEDEGCTVIAFPGGDEDVWRVLERPEAILAEAQSESAVG